MSHLSGVTVYLSLCWRYACLFFFLSQSLAVLHFKCPNSVLLLINIFTFSSQTTYADVGIDNPTLLMIK